MHAVHEYFIEYVTITGCNYTATVNVHETNIETAIAEFRNVYGNESVIHSIELTASYLDDTED